jgi:hypothetical protein
MYLDPVAKAEAELAELEALQKEELGIVDSPEPVEGQEAAQEPQEEQPVKDEPPQQPEAQEEDPNSDTYKARWTTLQSMHKSYLTEIETLRGQVGTLLAQNEALRQQPAAPQTPQQPQGTGKTGNVEEAFSEMEAEYGQAFTQALDRIIQARTQQIVQSNVQPFAERVSSVEARQVKSAQDEMHDAMTREIKGDWRSLNGDQDFISWLQGSRKGRMDYQSLLRDAYQAGDVHAVSEFFNEYLDRNGNGQPVESQQQPQPNRVPSPQNLVVPNRRATGSHTRAENAQGKVFTMAEINAFYKNLELGKIPAEQAQKMEADIFKANAEGRIIG